MRYIHAESMNLILDVPFDLELFIKLFSNEAEYK